MSEENKVAQTEETTEEPRKLTLKDLKLEVRTQDKVWGGFSDGQTANQWAFGPRTDNGAGDAAAWNEGDITLAEAAQE